MTPCLRELSLPKANQPINIAKRLCFYSFDVMGDLAFGKSLHIPETSRNHWAIDLLSVGILPLALQLPVWLLRFGMSIPILSRDRWKFIGLCRDSLQSRIKCESDVSYIMSTLFDSLEGGGGGGTKSGVDRFNDWRLPAHNGRREVSLCAISMTSKETSLTRRQPHKCKLGFHLCTVWRISSF